jgi:hypothetical protein
MDLAHKYHTFRTDPIGSFRRKTYDEARGLLTRFSIKQLQRSGAFHCLSGFLALRPRDAIPPDYADLWFLYNTARRRKPSVILEFGSGSSTAVLAQAIWMNRLDDSRYTGRLYSVDADPYWADSARRALPDYLHEVCEISYSPLIEVDYNGTPAFRHAIVPNVVPQLVYLDGPALTAERVVAIDVLDLEDRLATGCCLIVDGRIANTNFLRKHLRRPFRFTENTLLFNHVFSLRELSIRVF